MRVSLRFRLHEVPRFAALESRIRADAAANRPEIVTTDKRHEDVYVAVHDAFDAVRRRLEDAVRETRGGLQVHEFE